jgi:hypothetical protein
MILVGNSLSFCVGDLLSGEQTWPEGQKLVLVACTCLTSPEEAYKAYSPSYWRGHSKEVVMALLERLWPHVVQPRQYHEPYAHFAGGSNWFVTETLNPREITNELIERERHALLVRSPRPLGSTGPGSRGHRPRDRGPVVELCVAAARRQDDSSCARGTRASIVSLDEARVPLRIVRDAHRALVRRGRG